MKNILSSLILSHKNRDFTYQNRAVVPAKHYVISANLLFFEDCTYAAETGKVCIIIKYDHRYYCVINKSFTESIGIGC